MPKKKTSKDPNSNENKPEDQREDDVPLALTDRDHASLLTTPPRNPGDNIPNVTGGSFVNTTTNNTCGSPVNNTATTANTSTGDDVESLKRKAVPTNHPRSDEPQSKKANAEKQNGSVEEKADAKMENPRWVIEIRNKKPTIVDSESKALMIQKNCPPKLYIRHVFFQTEEEANQYVQSYIAQNEISDGAHASPNRSNGDGSPANNVSPSTVLSSADSDKIKKSMTKFERKCNLVFTVFCFEYTTTVVFLMQFMGRDDKEYWSHKPSHFSLACKTYQDISGPEKFGRHHIADIYKNMNSVVLRDKNGGPNQKMMVKNNGKTYYIYANQSSFTSPDKTEAAAEKLLRQFVDDIKQTVNVPLFQECYQQALGDSSQIWDKMGGHQSDYWYDFRNANIIINYEKVFNDMVPTRESEVLNEICLTGM